MSQVANPAISVIVCTWNRAELLRESLKSLSQQRGIDAASVEVIVVDNNSNDHTREVVAALASHWPLGSLVYLFVGRQGKQFALNEGLAIAKSPILAFTDDDIEFPPDWLARVTELFRDPAIDLAGGKTLIRWGPSGAPAWFAPDMLAVLAGIDLGDKRLDPSPKDYAPGGSNLIARRDLFDRVGGYSEKHFRHMDHEFGIRCQGLGKRVVYEPSLTVYAPVDEACLTVRYFQRWSLKAGIARSGGVDAVHKRFPAVPAWIYRQALEDAAAMLARAWKPRSAQNFSRELRLWRAWGTISNAWHAWIRPKSHAQWVVRHSQKKNNRLF